tara:strand:- start:3230 stop:3337 length:108 start_codon:yes stop_codon:yes gene_type:complete
VDFNFALLIWNLATQPILETFMALGAALFNLLFLM